MTQLATICYIDNGDSLLLLHRNKKKMMSTKASGFQLEVSSRLVRPQMSVPVVRF